VKALSVSYMLNVDTVYLNVHNYKHEGLLIKSMKCARKNRQLLPVLICL